MSGLVFTQSEHAKLSTDVKVSGKYHEQHLENKNLSCSAVIPHL